MKYYKTFCSIAAFMIMLIANLFAQWGPDVRLTYADDMSYLPYNNARSIASNGDMVYVVFYDFRDHNYEIYYKRSSDSGTTWGTDNRFTNNSAGSSVPSIAISDSNVYAIWQDGCDGNQELYFKLSTDSGVTWGINTRLTYDTAASYTPSVGASGAYIHVVWQDDRDGNKEIYYKRSSDSGTTWGTDIRLTDNSAISAYPSVAVSGPYIHVVWQDNRDGNKEIYYKRSSDSGTTWGIDSQLTDNASRSEYPSVAVSAASVFAVWMDNRNGNWDIYTKRSIDSGTNWGVESQLTDDLDDSESPSAVISASNIHVVWSDWRDGYYPEIYYKHSADLGTSWGTDVRLTNDPAQSSYPSLAVSGSYIHVVWEEYRDGNVEIYYKRNPTGNAISEEASSIKFIPHLEISPNPFTTVTRIDLLGISDHQNIRESELHIYDPSGRLVKSVTLTSDHCEIGTDLIPGIYFLKLNGNPVGKLVKVR